MVLLYFLAVNVVFACVYYALSAHFNGMVYQDYSGRFKEAFFFSTQTFTTVGYGRVNPIGFAVNLISSFEALFGILSAALMTGVLYGRFSRPQAGIVFSKNALISPFQGGSALMLRLANIRDSKIIEAECRLMASYVDTDENGKKSRAFYNLPLEFDKVNFLALNWTVVHPINPDSPLFGLTDQDYKDGDIEFVVMFKAYDSTYSQQVYANSSYKQAEVIWNAKFVPMFKRAEGANNTVLELDKLGEYTLVDPIQPVNVVVPLELTD